MLRTANPRINAVLSEISVGDKVADIGCDHGIVANLAVEITKNVVFATDISAPSLFKAQQLAESLGQTNKVVCKVGDGLQPVEDEDIDTIIIAGMGGNEIIKILSLCKKRFTKYILVPHRDAKKLRQFLLLNGYGVKKDYIVLSEKKYYPVIVAEGSGQADYSPFELYFGKTGDVRREYAEKRLLYIKKLLPQTNGERYCEIANEIRIIEDEYENK